VPGTVDCEGGVVGTIRDITDHKRQARQIRRQRDELDTLNRINALVHEIIDGLLDATTRDEIETTVCERLAASELYEDAWIAERDGDGVAVRAGAGADDYYATIDGEDVSGGGVDETLSTGETLVVNDLVGDDRVPEPVREEARSRGYLSCVVVPLGYGSATYGALVVNAIRRDAFSERERAAFELLGETVGFAVNAVQNRRLLLGDNLVEYRFHVSDTDAFLFQVSKRLDAICKLEWTVPDDDSVLLYASVADADPDEVLALAAAHENVRNARVLGDGDDGTLFEVAVTGNTATALFESGAKPTEFVAESGSADITIEAPPSVDVETVVEAFESETELVAKRDVGRATRTASDFREAVGAELTDRQRSVLQAAYHAGYFDRPRDSTAEELADALGVSSATVHYHLRRAQAALVAEFLDE
jgi:predicted DNA binding protein